MKARKLADAQELVSRANGDKKVQKLIGKKPPAAKKGRPPAAAKATAKAAAKATAKATAKSKGKGKKVDHQEVEPCEDPSGEGVMMQLMVGLLVMMLWVMMLWVMIRSSPPMPSQLHPILQQSGR